MGGIEQYTPSSRGGVLTNITPLDNSKILLMGVLTNIPSPPEGGDQPPAFHSPSPERGGEKGALICSLWERIASFFSGKKLTSYFFLYLHIVVKNELKLFFLSKFQIKK